MAKADLTGLHLNSFLKLGFFVDWEPDLSIDFSHVDPSRWGRVPERELVTRCAELWRGAVASRFEAGRRHCVPLSGGLDSRAILAVLLECTEARNIDTCTFGTPGTHDFELGTQVARAAGTRHVVYPLTQTKYRLDDLLDASRRIRHQTVLFHHPPLRDMAERFGAHVIWSGFLGDKLTVAPQPCSSPEQARRNFVRTNTYVKSTCLSAWPDARLADALELPRAGATALGPADQLGFRYRQLSFIAPHVLPLGFEYRLPFLDPAIVGFFLSLPGKARQGGRFYRRFLARTFPALFSIGTKSNEGLPLGASRIRVRGRWARRRLARSGVFARRDGLDPMTNYVDFGRAIREREDLKSLIGCNAMALEKRDCLEGVDVEDLWRRHQRGDADHSDALIVLASLEIHLKAGMAL